MTWWGIHCWPIYSGWRGMVGGGSDLVRYTMVGRQQRVAVGHRQVHLAQHLELHPNSNVRIIIIIFIIITIIIIITTTTIIIILLLLLLLITIIIIIITTTIIILLLLLLLLIIIIIIIIPSTHPAHLLLLEVDGQHLLAQVALDQQRHRVVEHETSTKNTQKMASLDGEIRHLLTQSYVSYRIAQVALQQQRHRVVGHGEVPHERNAPRF
jgi:hypothetical protein